MADKDWRVTFHYVESATGRINDTTFCVREHVSVPGADNLSAATVAQDLADWLTSLARNMAPAPTSLSRVSVNRGGPWGPGEGDDQEAGEAAINLAGTLATAGGGSFPHPLCMRVTLKTALASKRGMGRFHAPWPGSDLAQGTDDTWSTGSTYWANVVAFANALLAGHDVTHDTITHHYSLRVHSRKDGTTRDVVAVIPRTQISFLRSRLTAP